MRTFYLVQFLVDPIIIFFVFHLYNSIFNCKSKYRSWYKMDDDAASKILLTLFLFGMGAFQQWHLALGWIDLMNSNTLTCHKFNNRKIIHISSFGIISALTSLPLTIIPLLISIMMILLVFLIIKFVFKTIFSLMICICCCKR